jgi:hypothetical protein
LLDSLDTRLAGVSKSKEANQQAYAVPTVKESEKQLISILFHTGLSISGSKLESTRQAIDGLPFKSPNVGARRSS